jgi:hypothetical protein
MKGTLFVELLSLIESKYGLEVLDAVIEAGGSSLSTSGAYTRVGNYPHEEIFTLATAVCKVSGDSLESLLDDFANSMVCAFHRMHPAFFAENPDILDFLDALESQIHTEVRKLYPDAKPPLVLARRIDKDSMEISYQSSRPLAPMAIALTRATAEFLNQPVSIEVINLAANHKEMMMKVSRSHA